MDADDGRSGERDPHVSGPVERPPAGSSTAHRPGPTPGSAGSTGARSGVAVAGLGFQFAAALVGFFYLGQWLDRRFGTAPVFLLGCVLVGSGTAFYAMYRQLMSAQRRATAGRAADRGPESRP